MSDSDETRLDQNVKRVDVGALVTVLNASTQTRQHYYLSTDGKTDLTFPRYGKVDVVKPTEDIAQVLMGKMKGDKVFFRHNLQIVFIEWPAHS